MKFGIGNTNIYQFVYSKFYLL